MEAKRGDEALVRYLLEKLAQGLEPKEQRLRGAEGLHRMAEHGRDFVAHLRPGELCVELSNRTIAGVERTVVQMLVRDQPFLVDSFRLNLRRLGLREKLLLHPTLVIEREEDGSPAVVGVGSSRESYLYAEVSPVPDAEQRERCRADLVRTFGQIRDVVADHGAMLKALRVHTAGLELSATPADATHTQELMDFLYWLAADNFVFLGYRRYTLDRSGAQGSEAWGIQADPESGLGALRDAGLSRFHERRTGAHVPGLIRTRIADERRVFFDKSNVASRVHREGRLDTVSIKIFDDSGRLCGFGKFVGLLTYQAVRTRPSEIPIIRRRRERVLEALAPERGSHTYKAALEAFDSLPLEFLFSFDVAHVTEAARGILRAYEGRSVELVMVPDALNQSFFLSVILPRSLYREHLRADLCSMLVDRYRVEYLDHRITFVDDDCALIHFFCSLGDDSNVLDLLPELEREVKRCTLLWEDRFEAALLEHHTEDEAFRLAREYAGGFPEDYRVLNAPEHAHHDIRHLERIRTGLSSVELAFAPIRGSESQFACLVIYQRERPYLTDLLPLLDQFGLRARDAKLFQVRCRSGGDIWIGAIDVERSNDAGAVLQDRERRVIEGLRAVMADRIEADALNGLIFALGIDWQQVDLLRAYFAYAAQIGYASRPSVISDALRRYPEATRAVIHAFSARFDPEIQGDRESLERSAQEQLQAAREPIPTADEDRVFAVLDELIRATVRTSYYAPADEPEPPLAFKLDPKSLSFAPHPRPWMEIFVHSVEMTGVHLRGGAVARGGLRWSERAQDFRNEVLGLMKTQMVKNGLIVPVGAKGGFVLRRWFGDPSAAREVADVQYARFIRALLGLTDNMEEGRVVPPDGVIRHDGDDPYLVVAPDKGTAHLSDVANRVAGSMNFWLGDAFASGGSDGYDHKAEGITARGAWICVRRHFRELGLDIEREPFSMVGIGDMSGDVFGNGLLLARNARLVAAFNHQHVFLDPDPDAVASWTERKRLFDLPRSSWRDYDVEKISRGGGVFDRSAKHVGLSEQAKSVLGLSVDGLSGEELVRAILKMPVDLLWNGGIGTYVKSRDESHTDVGDRSNDAVRVDACELRVRVVGEGGNLGFTQLARVEYALAGGRINTDAVDNSAGVDLSDLEVNFKILLSGSLQSHRMSLAERNVLLRDCSGQADAYVIAHNEAQSHGISMDMVRCAENPERMILAARFLERNAGLDRALEFLPGKDELRARTRPGRPAGYARPELAVLLGYSKLLAKRELATSELIEHPSFVPVLESYFPDRLRECFGSEILEHPLRREITATVLTNRVLDRAGVTLLPELTRTLGVGVPDILAAYYIVNHMLEAEHLRWAIERQEVAEEVRLGAARRVESAVRWGTRTRLGLERRVMLEPEELAHWTGLVRRLREMAGDGIAESERARVAARARTHSERGLDPQLADEIEHLPFVVRSLGVISLAIRTNAALPQAVRLHTEVGRITHVTWLLDRLGDLERRGGWDRVAAEALVLELLETQRRITSRLLERHPEGGGLGSFCEERSANLRTIAEAAQEIEGEERRGLAPLAVLSQMIRRLC